MYCGKCGNEIINGDEFCTKCGHKVTPKIETKIEVKESVVEETNDFNLSMKWYKFYTYILLPISLLGRIITLFSYDEINFGVIIDLLTFILMGIQFTFLIYKKKTGYYLTIVSLIVVSLESFIASMIKVPIEASTTYATNFAGLMGYIIGRLLWMILIPTLNIIYFNKRKEYFK